MKTILVIAPSCFPVTGAEAIVNIKLLNALSNSGEFTIDLISKKRSWVNYPSNTIDSYGVKLRNLRVIEVDNKLTVKSFILTLLTVLKFRIFYPGCHWAYAALPEIERLVRSYKYDYVLTKDTPSFILGAYLKKKYGLRWVATWNDPFPGDKYPFPYGKGKDYKSNMDDGVIRCMRKADHHLFPNDRIYRYMNSYLKIDDSVVSIAPHIVLDLRKRVTPPDNGVFKIVHTGKLSKPRDPRTFITALNNYLVRNPQAKISLDIIGGVDDELESFIDEIGARSFIRLLSPVEYMESLSLLNNYDAAVIIEADCEEGIFIPTKVSDFMQCQIPIFSVSPGTGVLHDLYKKNFVAYFARVDSVKDIEEAIKSAYDDFKNKSIVNKAFVDPSFMKNSILSIYSNL